MAEIKERLEEGEAAVEMVRIKENHQVYYGDKVRYVAFIITKDMALPKLIEWSIPGNDLEDKFFKYYRSAIRFRLKDTLSYKNYWKPIEDNLPDDVRTIYFAPDGVYHLLNPQTFFNTSTGQYLLDEIDIRFVPTISIVSTDRDYELKLASLFGYPTYIDNPSPPDTTHTATSRSNLLTNEIYGLPGTKVEVEKIRDILKDQGIDVFLFVEKEVNKKNIYANNRSDISSVR